MTTVGMDTVAGLAASTEIDQGSVRIAELAQRLDGALRSFDWQGTDAERTFDTWGSTERPALDNTVQQLAAMALLIRQEAQAQDVVSGEGATTTAATPGSAPPQDRGLLATIGRFVGDRISAAFDGLVRTAGHTGDFLGKVGDVLLGREDHSVAEIAASALAATGAAAGTLANVVTGKDENWFGEGPGLAGTPVAVATDPLEAGTFSPVLARPVDLPSLMQGVTDGYQVGEGPGSNGDVRITRVDNGNGPAYVVAIPGTERWWPDAGPEGRDLSANVNLVAGNPTAAAESVRRAMDAAGIPPGSPVLLVGHSQGGIIAGQLASDPAFVQRYGVLTDVVTYGAPIDHMTLAPGVSALQVQHGVDLVPRLDLGGVSASGFPDRVQTVTLDSPGNFWELGTNHSHTEYRDSVRDALGSDSGAGRTLREYQSTLAPFLVTPGGSATAVDVPVSEETEPMGLLSRMLGGRPGESAITETVGDAVRVLPGVTGHALVYNHQQNASGAISGVVEVADTPTYLEVLRTVRRVLDGLLGDGANRVTFYLTGRTPDGGSVTPGELGLSQPPSGREIAQRLMP